MSSSQSSDNSSEGIPLKDSILQSFYTGLLVPHKTWAHAIRTIHNQDYESALEWGRQAQEHNDSLTAANRAAYNTGLLLSIDQLALIPFVALTAGAYATGRGARKFARAFNPEGVAFAIQNYFFHPEHYVPHEMTGTFADIDFEKAHNMGAKAVVFDLEGTLIAGKQTRIHPDMLDNYIEGLEIYGPEKFVGVSNLPGSRKDKDGYADRLIQGVREQLSESGVRNTDKMPILIRHEKLKPGHIPEVEDMTGVSLDESLVIGDFRPTDIAFGNKHGAYTIEVVEFPGEIKDGKFVYDSHAIRARNNSIGGLYLAKRGVKAPLVHLQEKGLEKITAKNYLETAPQNLRSIWYARMRNPKYVIPFIMGIKLLDQAFMSPPWAEGDSWLQDVPSDRVEEALVFMDNRRDAEKIKKYFAGLITRKKPLTQAD